MAPGKCRHHQICVHFGETPKWRSCEACDTCSGQPAWLSARQAPVQTTAKKPAAGAKRGPAADVDRELREYLREWRRTTAKQNGIAAFMVMHDTSLDDLCRKRPGSLAELRGVSGFGERKTEVYGQQILEALRDFRPETAPRFG